MPYVEGITVDRFAHFGVILEKNYTLQIAYSLLQGDPSCQNLEKILNPGWGQEIIYFDYNQVSSVVISAQGSPLAANAVERLKRTGVKKIVSIGTAGSTNQEIIPGTYALPIAGVRDEGTSSGYLDIRVPALANLELVRTLDESLTNLGVRTLLGVIFTSDKRYKEDPDLLKSLHDHAQVIAIDMETTSVFITAMYHGIAAAAIKIITDCAIHEGEGTLQGVFRQKDVDYGTWIQPLFETALRGALQTVSDS
jgi:purine-nucleoside phosphorylase